jgi:demethylmenaquinone methyltransferase/2-methoxy-6-polyprenyl-1,4-benzoquinol methylase
MRRGLEASLATPDDKARYVRRLFATIADRYDLITRVLSYGLDASWKRRLVAMADAVPGSALDLACGTGDLSYALCARGRTVVGLDITPRMIELAVARGSTAARSHFCRSMTFLVGDMTMLPFADASFDVITTGYGLRNVARLEPAIDEVRRVLRPRGVFLSLDFDRPDVRPVRWVYLTYLTIVGSALGWLLHGDPDTYRYIPESIKRYPGASEVARLLAARGFTASTVVPVLGGLMAINTARRA